MKPLASSALVIAVLLAVALSGCATRGRMITASRPLYAAPDHVETRWASRENPAAEKGRAAQANAGRKGAPAFTLPAGAAEVLAQAAGSGTVRRIWITIIDRSPQMLRGIRLDFYWDGAPSPAVSVPIGDFFGHGLGRMAAFENALLSSPEGRSFNCLIPMPFRSGMRIVATNETDTDLRMFFYDVDYTIGDHHGDDVLYFHSCFRRENPTTLQRDYEILPHLPGRGRYLGATIGVIPDTATYGKSWWGEGEVKVYLDGDRRYPTLSGTGTEDYIGTGWGQGQYANLYQGCPTADRDRFQYCFYRLHVPDPVYFHEDVRVTIQQIGWGGADHRAEFRDRGITLYRAGEGLQPVDLSAEGSIGLFERQDDWSSCAYFYLDRPENGLPPLIPYAERIAGLE